MTLILNKGLKPHKAFEGACLLVSSYYQGLLDKQRDLDDYLYENKDIDQDREDQLDKYQHDITINDIWYDGDKDIRILFGTEAQISNLSLMSENVVKLDNLGILFPPLGINEMPSLLSKMIKGK